MTGSDTYTSFLALFANFLVCSARTANTQPLIRQLVTNLSLVGRYAFSDEVYRAHPLPRRPARLADTRKQPWFRTLDIFLSVDRKVNYRPNPPLKPLLNPTNRRQVILRCIAWTLIYSLLVDFFTLWLPLLGGHGLYRPDGARDFGRFCEILRHKYGLPASVFRAMFMICYIGTLFCGMQGGWEEVRGLAVGSGIWLEEEWPDLMNRPYLSTSMIELWGKRYHQVSQA